MSTQGDFDIMTRMSTPESPATIAPPALNPAEGKEPELSSTASPTSLSTKKRPAATAEPNGATKVTKRRAARACVSCRARKVRCDVVEGAPCGNCRWDNVECVVQESRRRKKNIFATPPATAGPLGDAEALRGKGTDVNNPVSISSADLRRASTVSAMPGNASESGSTVLLDGLDGHVPHLLYQRTAGFRSGQQAALLSKLGDDASRLQFSNQLLDQVPSPLFGDARTAQFLNSLEEPDLSAQLPAFIKPLPAKIAPEDVSYLNTKGALSLPSVPLQNALIQAYVEFVHPYMPLLELHEFLNTVNARDGLCGQVSLLLYQAIMFSATAFVETRYLKEAGYANRKAARKAFFQKTRLLYDFDYESDRLVLVQALLLMTYWYETPDDQKDTWHWMGVAISLAHTIGLHRNPASTQLVPRKQKLWKRIWWSCFMRDRLIALGMRRPTRIKDEDFDVPMLEDDDFEIEALPLENQVLPSECRLARDVTMQLELAKLCIAKARLCVCISRMLKAQYSVLIRDRMRPDNTTNSTMMLFPHKKLDNIDSVRHVDEGLLAWLEALPACCQYRPLTPLDVQNGRGTVAVQRNLLHMVYYTTISALHRPQFLPCSPLQAPTASRRVQEVSRIRVRDAADQITRMAAELHHTRLERYLPTTGVTVVLPAMIIHLLEMKNPVPEARESAARGFNECMRVMERLRDIYAAADFATGFLDAALQKAFVGMNAAMRPVMVQNGISATDFGGLQVPQQTTPPPDNAPYLSSIEVNAFHRDRSYMQGPTMAGSDVVPMVDNGPSQAGTNVELDDVLTPPASGSSDSSAPRDHTDLAMDFELGQDEDLVWNAMTGTEFEFDQWLQFPTDSGVKNVCDDSLLDIFGGGDGSGGETVDENPDAQIAA